MHFFTDRPYVRVCVCVLRVCVCACLCVCVHLCVHLCVCIHVSVHAVITFPHNLFPAIAGLVFLRRPFFFYICQYLGTHINIKDNKYKIPKPEPSFSFCMFIC